MTNAEWEIVGQFAKDIAERFDDQENRIKHLEKQLELLTEDKKWIPEHRQVWGTE